MIRLFFILFFLCSCAHIPHDAHVKRIAANDDKEARAVIQNQLNFLHELFKQTKDPYYNVEKWSAYCLTSNKIGTVDEKFGTLYSISELWLRDNEPGHCPFGDKAIRSFVIYQFCEKEKEVIEVKISADSYPNFEEVSLCH